MVGIITVETKTETKEKLMTTKELAKILDVSEKTIKETCKRLGIEGTLTPLKTNGGIQKTIVFNEEQATLIKQEIQKHHNLKSRQIDNVVSELEENEIIANAFTIIARRNKELKNQLKIANEQLELQAPKVEFFDTVADSKDAMQIGDVAKLLCNKGYKIGRNRLFEILRYKHILDSNNVPYQKYVDLDYFRVIEQKYKKSNGDTCISIKTLVYQKGIDFIIKQIDKKVVNYE